jgi:hypothetical protein
MSPPDNPRDRCLEEIQRLHRQIQECAHCEVLRQHIVRLYEIMPPAPMIVGNQKWEYIGPWPHTESREDLLKRAECLHLKIEGCGHCASLRGQMVRLLI